MLRITIAGGTIFNERTNKFKDIKGQTIELEHSLISISKWESKWKKPFISKKEKTVEEIIDYVRCMCLTQNVDSRVFNNLSEENVKEIRAYIEDPMTATTLPKDGKQGKEVITSELIYYCMIACNIPIEFQKWHLNRLMTLIRVCEIKNSPQKKMSRKEILARNKALNDARRKKLGTTG